MLNPHPQFTDGETQILGTKMTFLGLYYMANNCLRLYLNSSLSYSRSTSQTTMINCLPSVWHLSLKAASNLFSFFLLTAKN